MTSKSSIDKFLSPPITPMKARAVKSFPIGKEWMYEPKWDGFRCLIFRDEENIFLQSRTGKSLAPAFPEIVAAFRALSPKRIVRDGKLAMSGFALEAIIFTWSGAKKFFFEASHFPKRGHNPSARGRGSPLADLREGTWRPGNLYPTTVGSFSSG